MRQFKNGEVVQLKSGGAPMTIIVDDHAEGDLKLAAVSVGGLVQELWVTPACVRIYTGPITPAMRPQK